MEQTIKVGWLFNNMFNLHGDRGNLLAIRAEAERRGYWVEVEQINLDTDIFNPLDFDFLFCPPGEIEHFEVDLIAPRVIVGRGQNSLQLLFWGVGRQTECIAHHLEE